MSAVEAVSSCQTVPLPVPPVPTAQARNQRRNTRKGQPRAQQTLQPQWQSTNTSK